MAYGLADEAAPVLKSSNARHVEADEYHRLNASRQTGGISTLARPFASSEQPERATRSFYCANCTAVGGMPLPIK